jgi:hypothetical protein
MRRFLLVLGPLFIAASFVLALQRVEPFATFFYLCAWYGLIFALDRLIREREGRSLIGRCGAGFFLLLFWSAVGWLFFELINLRLQNWYYVFVPAQPALRYSNTLIAFATVYPGIFWIEHYLALRGVGAGGFGRPLRFSARGRRLLQLAGLFCLVLPLLFPTYFFPLIWLALILILAPLHYDRDPGSFLRQLAEGHYGPTLRLLLAGLIAGLFWEFFNFWARAKWIYTVPFFDELKLFEMPLAGFLGFPPFAVECAILYRFLVWHRLAPRFGAYALQRPEPVRTAAKIAIFLLATLFALATHHYMDRMTVTSLTPRLAQVEGLDQQTLSHLENRHIHYLTDLEGRRAQNLWRELEKELDPQRFAALERRVRLYLHQGIGVQYGNWLVQAGINSLEELGKLSAEEVQSRLRATDPSAVVPPLARIRVWIRRVPGRG